MKISSSAQSNTNIKNGKNKENTQKLNFINNNLSGQAKKNNIIESLMKQKENLVDTKNTIMENGLKRGEDPKSIKEKIAEIDKQIEDINEQMNNIKLEEMKEKTTQDDKKKEEKKQTNKDSDILSLSNNYSQTKTLSAQAKTLKGEIRVLSSEIKADASRGIDTEDKRKRLSKIEDNLDKISEKIYNNLNKVNEKTGKLEGREQLSEEQNDNKDVTQKVDGNGEKIDILI